MSERCPLYPPKARNRHVRFVPKAAVSTCSKNLRSRTDGQTTDSTPTWLNVSDAPIGDIVPYPRMQSHGKLTRMDARGCGIP
jgi:hypothetical protein